MSFLSPLALAGLVLLSLPVIIHLLARRRGARLDFPTLRYLRETPSFRLRPRRIREPLLLALRLLALVLLIMGIARPMFTRRAKSSPVRLILIDASLSMRARGRAAAAKEEARSLVNKLAQDERAAVVSCGSEVSVLAPVTGERQELLAAVEKYEPGTSAIDFYKAFATAAALLAREATGAAEMDLISDFQQSNLASLETTGTSVPARVNPHAVGAALERNAFLLNETASRNESGVELAASEIVAAADGRSGARRFWSLKTSAGEGPDINWRTESNGQLTARVRTIAPDDFDADDERFFAFTPPRAWRVLLVETDAETSLYSGAALEAAGRSVERSHDGKYSELTRQKQLPASATELKAYVLVVMTLHGALREDELRVLSEFAEAGGTVWLSLAIETDVPALNALAASAEGRALPFKSVARLSKDASLSLGPADLAAAPLRSMTESAFGVLRAAKVHEGYALEARDDADTLARWSNGAAAFVSRVMSGGGRFLLLGTSTESAASEFGRSPAFPSLAFSILRESVATREPLSYELGEAVDLGLAPQTSLTITDEAGRAVRAMARDLMQRPSSVLSAPGIFRVESEKGWRFVALNTPVAESERALAEADEARARFNLKEPGAAVVTDERREEAERGGAAWRYFLGAAFVLLMAELLLGARGRVKQRATAEVEDALRVEQKL